MDMNGVVNLALAVLLLSYFFGVRFNEWPQHQEGLLRGKPNEYIDSFRFNGIRCLYIGVWVVFALLIYLIPNVVESFPIAQEFAEDLANEKTFLTCAILILALLADKRVASFDFLIRRYLHEWARIPRAIEEVKKNILQDECFFPTQRATEAARLTLLRFESSKSEKQDCENYWTLKLKNLKDYKFQRSIYWYYLRCVCLFEIVKDVGKGIHSDAIKMSENRLMELGRIIHLSRDNDVENKERREELDTLSAEFVEHICKYVIRKYPNCDKQCNTFKNLGFDLTHHDTARFRYFNAVVLCVSVMLVGSAVYSLGLMSIIEERSYTPDEFYSINTFLLWSLASFASSFLAVVISVVLIKTVFRNTKNNGYRYVSVLFVTTLAAFVFFVFETGLDFQSAGLPVARLSLAFSFSTLSLVVISALNNSSHDQRDVQVTAFVHGVLFGALTGALQVGVNLAFNPHNIPGSLVELLTIQDHKYLWIGGLGFLKGFIVGGGVSFYIQEIQRKQLIEAHRQTPRVDDAIVVTLIRGEDKLRANTKNISTKGLKIQCRERFENGEKVLLKGKEVGDLEAVVKWSKSRWMRSNVIGLAITKINSRFNQYIRNTHGEYFAG